MGVFVQQEHVAGAVADDGPLFEVVNGQRVESLPMGAFEVAMASALARFLGPFAVERKLGLVVTEMLFVLDAARDLKRRPDVAFVSFPRWPEPTVPRRDAWNVVPDLAVEVISPSNNAEDVDHKIVEYFQAGVRLVWVIYPSSGRVYVYTSATAVRVIERTGELDGGDVLAGLRLPIESLFAAVTKPE